MKPNGKPSTPEPRSLQEMREETKRLRAANRLADARHEHKLRESREKMLESLWLWDDWHTDSDLWHKIRDRDYEQGYGLPPSTASDRSHGANWPMWRTEQELDQLRQQSRVLCSSGGFGEGLLKNLTNAVIGKGFAYKAVAKDLVDVSDEPGIQEEDGLKRLCSGLQNFIDHFCKLNRWNSVVDPQLCQQPNETREREGYWRTKRDGDGVIRLFPRDDGTTLVRFVEPEQIRGMPNGATVRDGWSYGMQHRMEPVEDVEDIVAYHVVYQDLTTADQQQNSTTGDVVDAAWIVHIKDGLTDSAIKRALPAFRWDTLKALTRASKLQNAISVGSCIRASTAEIWEHEFGTKDQINELVAGLRERQYTDPVTNKQVNVDRIVPGTVRRVPMGQKLAQLPAAMGQGTQEHLLASQGDLRQAGTAFCAPEYIVSGDSSNNNFASIREAGTPWVRNGESEQEHFKLAYLVVMWKAVKWAVACKRLPPEVLTRCEIQAEAPKIISRDGLQKAQEDQIHIMAGVKSRQTVQMENGLDPEIEQANNDEWNERNGQQGQPLPMPGDGPPGAPPGGGPTASPFDGLESLLRESEWDESKHKRDAGKFSSTGGSSGGSSKSDWEEQHSDGNALQDSELFKRTGEGFENLQLALGIKKPKMGPDGANAVRQALAKHPGGNVIAAMLAVDGSETSYDRNGFAERGMDAYAQALNGKFSKQELDAAAAWLQDKFNNATPLVNVNQHRWLRGAVQTAKIKESAAWDESKHKRDKGQFSSSGGASAAAHTDTDAATKVSEPGFLAKAKALPAAVAQKAVGAAKNLYSKMESKYGSKWAKAIVITAIITMPTPFTMGAVAAMTGLAHLHLKLSGPAKATESLESDEGLTDEQLKAAAEALLAELQKALEAEDAK